MNNPLIWQYLSLISASITCFLLVFVLYRNWRKPLHQIFALNCLVFIVWYIASYFMLSATDPAKIIFWDRIVYAVVVFAPTLMYHFALVFSRQDQEADKKAWLNFGYLLAIIFLSLSRTNYFIHDVFNYSWGVHTQASIFHHVFLFYYFIYVVLFLIELFHYYRRQKPSITKTQAGYVLLAFLLIVILGSTAYLPAYRIAFYPVAYLSGLIFAGLVGWAIIRYRFMEIKFIIKQGLILFLTVLTLLLIFNYVIQSKWLNFFWVNSPESIKLLVIVFLAVSFDQLSKFYHWLLDYIFFTPPHQHSENSWSFLSALSDVTNVQDISEKLHRELFYLANIKKIEVLLYDQNSDAFAVVYPELDQNEKHRQLMNRVVYYLQTNPQLVLQAELDFLSRDTDLQLAKEVALILNKSNFSGVFPLLVEGRLIGIVGFTFDRVQLSVTEAKLIQILAQQVARVYQQSMLYNYSLHRLSIWQQGIGENKINL